MIAPNWVKARLRMIKNKRRLEAEAEKWVSFEHRGVRYTGKLANTWQEFYLVALPGQTTLVRVPIEICRVTNKNEAN